MIIKARERIDHFLPVSQFRLNLLRKPFLGLDTVAGVALAILSRLRPKQTVHPPSNKRSIEVNVNQKPT